MEYVAVGPGHSATHAEVTLGVGAFQLECYPLLLCARQQHERVEGLLAVDLSGGGGDDVDIFQDCQTVEILVSAVHRRGGIKLAGAYIALLGQHPRPEETVGPVENPQPVMEDGVIGGEAHRGGIVARGEVGDDIDIAEAVAHPRVFHRHFEVDLLGAGHGVGCE